LESQKILARNSPRPRLPVFRNHLTGSQTTAIRSRELSLLRLPFSVGGCFPSLRGILPEAIIPLFSPALALPLNKGIPTLIRPDLLPHTPHLKDRIVIFAGRSAITAIFILIPVEQRSILFRQLRSRRLRLAVPGGVKLIARTEKAERAILQPVEEPVLGRVGGSVSDVVKVDVWLDARTDLRVDAFFIESIIEFARLERESIRVLAVE
jgi:hypothetical protein